MEIALIKLLLNTGILILIWVVQLVIYPSFLYYTEENLNQWHKVYTQRISIVVMPLMLGQVIIYGYSLLTDWSLQDVFISGLILFNWIVTFLWAVPLHNKIQASNNSLQYRQSLVNVNWLRTIAWTLIFIISLIYYYAK